MSAYDDYLANLQAENQKKQQLVDSVREAANTNPDEFARMVDLSKSSKIAIDAIPEFKEEAQQAHVLGSAGLGKLWKESPVTSQWLSNPDNAKVAIDSIGNMGITESLVNSFKRGVPALKTIVPAIETINQSYGIDMYRKIDQRIEAGEDIKQILHDYRDYGMAPLPGQSSDQALETYKTMRDKHVPVLEGKRAANVVDIAKLQQERNAIPMPDVVGKVMSQDTFSGAFSEIANDPLKFIAAIGPESLMQSAPGLIASIPAGMAAGPMGAASTIGANSFLTDYANSILEVLGNEKVDTTNPDAIKAALNDPEILTKVTEQSLKHASIVGAFDALSAGVAGKVITPKTIGAKLAAKPLARELANVAIEAPVQGLLGGAGEAGGELAAGQELQPGNILAEFAGEFFGTPAEVASVSGKRIYESIQEARHADTAAGKIEQLNTMVQENPLATRSPEAFEHWMNAVTQDSPVQNVYINAETLKQSGYAEELAKVSPAVAAQYKDAILTGGDIEIPISEYAAKIAPTQLSATLLDDLRVQGETMTRREATEFVNNQSELLRQSVEQTMKEKSVSEEFVKSAQAVEKNLNDQLNEAGRTPSPVNKAYAQFFRDFVVTQAANQNMMPTDFYDKYMYRVQAEGQPALSQVNTADQNFKSWFGRSMLTNDEGKPQVLYHGTADNIESFDLNHPNRKDTGWLGTGVYLTDSTDMADAYAMQKRNTGGARPNVMPLYARLENPYYATDEDKSRIKAGGRKAADAFTEKLKAEGHDGIIYQAAPDAKEVVVFDPAAVKSVNNRGTFDSNNPDILKQSLSSRLPTAVKATEDPLGETLSINFDVTLSDPVTLGKNMAALMKTPNMRKLAGKGARDPKRQAEAFIDHVVNNLLWLHDHMPADMRERAEMWYDGGRKTAEVWADRYGISEMQGAATIAVLSPQNGWFANVSQAERIMDMVFGLRDFTWDAAMTAEAERISKEGGLDDKMQAAQGKTLGELLNNPDVAARWVRVYDQTYNNRAYRVLTPEGGAADYVKTGKGNDATMMWKSYSTISKAVSILTDGRAENVYYQLGREHKVRNFYNNLFSPNSDLGFTTIDTHAVAAALLRPLAASDTEVNQAFGSAGSASSSVTGLNGTYPIYLEAYKRAAESRGILPRQMQSITWEAVRGLFEAAKKSGLKKGADAIWNQYKAGKIDQAQAQQDILKLAGDITPPSWTEVPFNDTVSRTYEGPAQKVIDERGPVGPVESHVLPKVFFEVAPDPNDAELSAKWNTLPETEKSRISQTVAETIVPKVLAEVGTDGQFTMQIGGYEGATNPSMTLQVDRRELAITAAKLMGYALSQDSMMVVSEKSAVGMEPVGAISIDLPEGYGEAEVRGLYDRLWELEQDGKKLIGGHTTVDGHMVILNYSGLDNNALALIIDQHLGGEFTVRENTVYSAFPNKEDYNYAGDIEQASARGPSFEARANNLRAEATALLRTELAGQGVLYQSGIGSGERLRAGDQAVRSAYGTARTGSSSVVGVHYSGQQRASVSGDFYGTGLKGAESARLQQTDDQRLLNRIHFYVDTGKGVQPESGVGAYAHGVKLNNLYNTDEDPLGLLKSARAAGGQNWFNTFESSVIDNGFDGVYVPKAQGDQGVAVLLGDHNVQLDSLAKPKPVGEPVFKKYFDQPARGGFDPNSLTTILTEKTDYSTFLHETAHFFLTVYSDLAAQPNATAQVKDDMQTILNWFGVQDVATWNAMPLEEQRKYHEQFAYNYELYLFEGKAPSTKLQTVFERFSAWLRRVYKSIREDLNAIYKQEHGEDLPILTGEVRQVMDRMLATDEQIKQAESVRGMVPLYQNQQQSGMDDATWAAYQELSKEAQDMSIDKLTTDSLRQMRWLSNAKSRILKEMQKSTAEIRKEVRAEVQAEIETEPVYKALRWLRTGDLALGNGEVATTSENHKLAVSALEEMYMGEGDRYALLDWSQLPKNMVGKEGVHPDVLAEQVGFQSGDELVRALIEAPSIKEVVDNRTDQVMLERHGELVDQRSIDLAVERALHNEARARFVAAELRHAAKATQPVRLMMEAAKQAARNIINAKLVKDVRVSEYSIAETRSNRQAQAAMKAGDAQAVTRALQSRLMNNQLAAEAGNVMQEVEAGLRYMRNIGSDANRQKIGADYSDQIDALLERFELKPISLKEIARRQSLAEFIQSQRDAGYDPEISPEMENAAFRKPYKVMSVNEFRDLVDTVKQIEHLGKAEQNLLTSAKTVAYEAARDQMVESINENFKGTPGEPRTPTTNLGRALQAVKRFGAAHIKAATIARILDGGKDGGPVWEYLIRPANNAGDKEVVMRAKATEDLTKIMAPFLNAGKMGGKGQFFPSVGRALNKEARLAIALNMGNASNLQRLLDGEGWTIGQVMPVVESLSAAELKAVQQVWDYFESYRPQIAEKERKLYGKEPKWIEPLPVSIKSADGETVNLKGGYYPVKYDPQASQRAESFADAEDAKRQMQGAFTSSTTRRSFTKQRVEQVKGRPLLYTLAGMYNGVSEVIHDLAWHEFLIDANRLLRSFQIDQAIRNQYGPEFKQQLKSWVQDVAVGEQAAQHQGEMVLNYVRQGISAAGLGFNVMSALQQATGLSSSVVRIGPKYMGKGVSQLISSPRAAYKEVNEKSAFMANRARTQFRELNELRNMVQGESEVQRKIKVGTYLAMAYAQKMVDVPTWIGAYEKAMAEGNDEGRSIALADQAVIDSQGGGMLKDLSAVERGGPGLKLFTVFYSYMNTQLNLAAVQTMTAKSRGKLAADYLMLAVMPVVLGYAIKHGLTPDDKDEWNWEQIARDLAAEEMSYLMGLFVIMREFGDAGKIVFGGQGGNRDYGGPAGTRLIGDTIKFLTQAKQGDFDDSFRKASVNLIGDLTGLPSAQLNRTINGAQALESGKTQNPAAVLTGFEKR